MEQEPIIIKSIDPKELSNEIGEIVIVRKEEREEEKP